MAFALSTLRMIVQDLAENTREPINLREIYKPIPTGYHKIDALTRKDKYKNE